MENKYPDILLKNEPKELKNNFLKLNDRVTLVTEGIKNNLHPQVITALSLYIIVDKNRYLLTTFAVNNTKNPTKYFYNEKYIFVCSYEQCRLFDIENPKIINNKYDGEINGDYFELCEIFYDSTKTKSLKKL